MPLRVLAVLLSVLGCGRLPVPRHTNPGPEEPRAAETSHPLTQLPYTPGLDLRAMDRSVDPCLDFYAYACGGWRKSNPIPPDQSSWGVYTKVANENLMFLWGILENAARPSSGRTPAQQKIGDLFASCMDQPAVDRLGAASLKPFFDSIAGIKSTPELAAVLARLHLSIGTFGWTLMFGVGSNQDYGDSTQVIAFANAGGLGLPDRDYYVNQDAKSGEVRAKYVEHLRRMFQLIGEAPEVARTHADAVIRIETALAKVSLTRVERRDPYKQYHKMQRAQLQALMPSFDWERYFAEIGASDALVVNVTQPEFFKQWENQLRGESLDDLKSYLRWHVAHAEAAYLSSDFVEADFDFYSRTLRGVQRIRDRWKRCVAIVDQSLGEALGQEFVNRVFSPAMKQRTMEMAEQVEKVMEEDINQLPWMKAETKRQALEKLHSVVNKIGYPDKWRDYSSVKIVRNDFIGNLTRAVTFEKRRQLSQIGKPVDRGEWRMTPPTVNAYYSPQLNDINFPAGILQPPLYDFQIDDAPNFGNTGSTIGHELTHGFDDQGRLFDAKGNLRDWWTKQDAEEFAKRASCISEQYANYLIIDDIRINGKLTLGENVADLGGTMLAWMAWKRAAADQTLRPIDGLTPEQRFFVGNGQWACGNQRPEEERVRAIIDPHSPSKYRVIGVVVNMPEFQQAFSCKTGQPMAPKKRCRVW